MNLIFIAFTKSMPKKKKVLIISLIILASFLIFWLVKSLLTSEKELPIIEKDGAKYISNEILVSFKPETKPEMIAEIHEQIGGEIKETIPQIGVEVIEVPAKKLQEKLEAYQNNPYVEFAELNLITEISPPEPEGEPAEPEKEPKEEEPEEEPIECPKCAEPEESELIEEIGIKKEIVSNEILVSFKPEVSFSVIEKVHQELGGKIKKELPGLQIIEVPADQLQEKLEAYQNNTYVEFAQLHYVE